MTGEFALIEQFLTPFSTAAGAASGVALGPGDDCALLCPSPGSELCTTVDAVVEGVHFRSDWFSDEDIGHKALAINLSDLAAMGATPRWFVCSVACPPNQVARIPGLARGMAALAARFGVCLVGGNFSRASELSLHITATGEVPAGGALLRSGARPGDRLFVSGTLGDAALALDGLLRGLRAPPEMLQRQLRPWPRVELGVLARPFAHAAIDLSDGLRQDLRHVMSLSEIGVLMDAKRLPLSPSFRDMGAPLDLALGGGEDYELALFVPPERAEAFARRCREAGILVTDIGQAVEGNALTLQGAEDLGTRGGFDHFAGGPDCEA